MKRMGNSVIVYNKKATVEELPKLMVMINDRIFLKLGCEGCDCDIIPKLDMSKVSDIVMEYHMEREPLMEALAGRVFFRHTPRQNGSNDKSQAVL